MDGTGILFEPFVAALGDTFPITVVTYPPSADSQTYVGSTNLAALALPSKGLLVLLGESFSGPIAISLAAENPKRVVGVVLCCTFVRNPRPNLRWLSGLARIPAPLPPSGFLSTMLLGRFTTPRLRQMLRDALAKVPPAVLRARLRAVVSVDVREQARTLDSPVLYLKATSDRLVSQLAVVEVEKYCQNLTVHSFDAPHCLLQAVPVEAAKVVADFVKKVSAP